MSNTTENYKLKKPLPEEFYDVNVQNENMDIIDAELKKRATLGEDGKVSEEQLPDTTFIPVTSEIPSDANIWIDPDDDIIDPAPVYESTDHPGCHYRIVDGEIEWINPPMIEQVEYRTTERFDGKPVYIQNVCTYGSVEANNERRLDTNIGDGGDPMIIDMTGTYSDSYDNSVHGFGYFPINSKTSNLSIRFSNYLKQIYVYNSANEAVNGIRITIKYVKVQGVG